MLNWRKIGKNTTVKICIKTEKNFIPSCNDDVSGILEHWNAELGLRILCQPQHLVDHHLRRVQSEEGPERNHDLVRHVRLVQLQGVLRRQADRCLLRFLTRSWHSSCVFSKKARPFLKWRYFAVVLKRSSFLEQLRLNVGFWNWPQVSRMLWRKRKFKNFLMLFLIFLNNYLFMLSILRWNGNQNYEHLKKNYFISC